MTFQDRTCNKPNPRKNPEKRKPPQNPEKYFFSGKIRAFVDRIKKLQGDPSYVARGMAIGVFIGVTPTIPFHTAIAIALAFVFKASKPAAIVGVWFGNPVTVPLFYFGSYKVGSLLFSIEISTNLEEMRVSEMLELGAEVTAAIMCGGIIIAIPFGIAAFFITRFVFHRLQIKRKAGLERIDQSPKS